MSDPILGGCYLCVGHRWFQHALCSFNPVKLMALMTQPKPRVACNRMPWCQVVICLTDNHRWLALWTWVWGFLCKFQPHLQKPPSQSQEPDSLWWTSLPGMPRPRATRTMAAMARQHWRCGAGRRRRRSCKPTAAARTWSTRKGYALPFLLVVVLGLGSDQPGCPSVPSYVPGKDGLDFTLS